MPPGTSFRLPGTLPICPDKYSVLPTLTASENGNVVGSTFPELRYSTPSFGAAPAAVTPNMALSAVSINRLFFMLTPRFESVFAARQRPQGEDPKIGCSPDSTRTA